MELQKIINALLPVRARSLGCGTRPFQRQTTPPPSSTHLLLLHPSAINYGKSRKICTHDTWNLHFTVMRSLKALSTLGLGCLCFESLAILPTSSAASSNSHLLRQNRAHDETLKIQVNPIQVHEHMGQIVPFISERICKGSLYPHARPGARHTIPPNSF